MGVSDYQQTVVTSVAVGGVLALAAAGYIYYRGRATQRRSAGNISQIIIYPIKSGPPLYIQSAECTEVGLRHRNVYDRQFVIVNPEANEFISVRKNLKLLNLKLSYNESENRLILEGPGMENLSIPLEIPAYNSSQVKSFIWYDQRETHYLDMGEHYSNWFTSYLGQSCRFGYSHPEINRPINPKFIYNAARTHPDTKILFPNSHPFMVANQASLEDLNTRLAEPVTMQGFRPNIIVSGEDNTKPQPYEEDTWRELAIGPQAVLHNNRPCPRCPMIYVDYEKHEMRPSKEPMTTLLKYRRGTQKQDKSKTVFGINVSLIRGGVISVNDALQVTSE